MTATGKDVHALKGMLKEAGEENQRRNENANKHYGMIEMEDSHGKRDVYRQDQAEHMERRGFVSTSKSFIVPDLPWLKEKE